MKPFNHFSSFERQIEAAQRGLAKLYDSEVELSAAEKAELVAEFAISLEELQVTAEELTVRNTELIEARYEIERERQHYLNLFELAPDGYIATDKHGTILNANLVAETLLKVRRDRLKGKPLSIFVNETSRREYYFILNSLTNSKLTTNWQIQLLPREGKPFYGSVSLAIERNDRGEIERLLWAIRDISDRLAAEQKIRQQAQLLEVTTNAIAVVNLENRVTYWNSSAEKLYGWSREEVFDRDVRELWGEKVLSELEAAKKCLLKNQKWQGELKKLNREGNELLVESYWSLVFDCRGELQEIMMVDVDITEKRRLELQAYHSQRLESLGTLASGIAHDLNNILNPILGSIQLLQTNLVAPGKTNLKLLKAIEKNAKRGAAIVRQVLTYSRSKETELVLLDTNEVLREVDRAIEEVFPNAIEIEFKLAENLWMVEADSTQIYQAILNLCINARDAMPNGGKLTISSENRFVEENYARQHSVASVGNYVAINVADTGDGIPPDVLERIFEPFFTTKDIGKGTGLGLFTVREIVKKHGGFVNIVTEVQRGTRFEIFLPAVERELGCKPTETAESEREVDSDNGKVSLADGNEQLILVVDDENDNLEMTQVMLEMAGYRVMAANSGDEAIALFDSHRDEIQLVLMDMMMPDMDGATASQHLVNLDPQVKIIALSGLACEYSLADNPYVIDFIGKPIAMENLLAAIERVLEVQKT